MVEKEDPVKVFIWFTNSEVLPSDLDDVCSFLKVLVFSLPETTSMTLRECGRTNLPVRFTHGDVFSAYPVTRPRSSTKVYQPWCIKLRSVKLSGTREGKKEFIYFTVDPRPSYCTNSGFLPRGDGLRRKKKKNGGRGHRGDRKGGL